MMIGMDRREAYSERCRQPEETVSLLRPHLLDLGITRIARQTALDVVGIPCYAAIRPNSKSIATNQGKGIDDGFAMASAVMEAAEFAIAESPQVSIVRASRAELESGGRRCWSPRRFLPIGNELSAAQPIDWIEGRRLIDGATMMVPLDLASHSGNAHDLPGICQTTNGLASGNTEIEATFHAVCELIERDAGTMWSFLETSRKTERCIDPGEFADQVVDRLVALFARGGLALRLFDQTTDVGVPTVLAVCGPQSPAFAKHFDLAAGSGTHPDPMRAAIRAITEAAQTRVTAIAGARDDRSPGTYRMAGNMEAFELLASEPRRVGWRDAPHRNVKSLLADVVAALAAKGVDDLVCCPLGGDRYGIAVVRVISGQLEDKGANLNWRPGPRALVALAEAA